MLGTPLARVHVPWCSSHLAVPSGDTRSHARGDSSQRRDVRAHGSHSGVISMPKLQRWVGAVYRWVQSPASLLQALIMREPQ